MLWDASAINGYAIDASDGRLGPSATCFSKTSAGSFDGLWSTPEG